MPHNRFELTQPAYRGIRPAFAERIHEVQLAREVYSTTRHEADYRKWITLYDALFSATTRNAITAGAL